MPCRLARCQHRFDLAADDMPGIGPVLATRRAQCGFDAPGIPKARSEPVIENLCEAWTPKEKHRMPRRHEHRNDRAKTVRPHVDGAKRRHRPIKFSTEFSHRTGAGKKSRGRFVFEYASSHCCVALQPMIPGAI